MEGRVSWTAATFCQTGKTLQTYQMGIAPSFLDKSQASLSARLHYQLGFIISSIAHVEMICSPGFLLCMFQSRTDPPGTMRGNREWVLVLVLLAALHCTVSLLTPLVAFTVYVLTLPVFFYLFFFVCYCIPMFLCEALCRKSAFIHFSYKVCMKTNPN